MSRRPPVKRPRGGASLLCPRCRAASRVLLTRRAPNGAVVRRRVCSKGHEFASQEQPK